MIEEELIRIWQSSPNQERVKFESSRLMIEVQSNLDRFQKEMKNRDRMDMMSIIVAIPAFAFATYFVPFMLSKIASGLIVAWSLFLSIRLRKAKKNKPEAVTATYLEYLNKSRQLLLDQKRLMETVLYWAIIPFVIFTWLFFIGFMEKPGVTLNRTFLLCGGSIVFAIIVYLMNKWAIKNQILPRLDKIDKLIRALEQE